jgi:hypothetical protein
VRSYYWRVVALTRAVAGAAVLLGAAMAQVVSDSSPTSLAQEWHSVVSPFCSDIRAQGAKISGRPFAV